MENIARWRALVLQKEQAETINLILVLFQWLTLILALLRMQNIISSFMKNNIYVSGPKERLQHCLKMRLPKLNMRSAVFILLKPWLSQTKKALTLAKEIQVAHWYAEIQDWFIKFYWDWIILFFLWKTYLYEKSNIHKNWLWHIKQDSF